MNRATAVLLPDGERLHLQHGPMDLIVQAFGPPGEIEAAYARASQRFETILDELVGELAQLRRPIAESGSPFRSVVARRMERAIDPFRTDFITPMAAVAGAVADEIRAAMTSMDGSTGPKLRKLYVNNGGDISVFIGENESFEIGIVSSVDQPAIAMTATVTARDKVRGIATSGWSGRSLSLGIADAVTVLAASAAAADAAATMIANAVTPGDDPAIERQAARDLDPDSDLGNRLVTTKVGALSEFAIEKALAHGSRYAARHLSQGNIIAAALCLKGHSRIVGHLSTGIETDPRIEEFGVSEMKQRRG